MVTFNSNIFHKFMCLSNSLIIIGIRPPISRAKGLRKTWETTAVLQNKGKKIETFLEIYKWKQK